MATRHIAEGDTFIYNYTKYIVVRNEQGLALERIVTARDIEVATYDEQRRRVYHFLDSQEMDGRKLTSSDLYALYTAHCQENDITPRSSKAVMTDLSRLLHKARVASGYIYIMRRAKNVITGENMTL